MTGHERLDAALAQLVADGRPDLAGATLWLVVSGHADADQAVEAIEAAEAMGTAVAAGEITEETAYDIARQMAIRHHSGVKG